MGKTWLTQIMNSLFVADWSSPCRYALGVQDTVKDGMYENRTNTLPNSTQLKCTLRDSVRAELRNLVRIALRRYKYPADMQAEAIDLVMKQAEVLSNEWTRDYI